MRRPSAEMDWRGNQLRGGGEVGRRSTSRIEAVLTDSATQADGGGATCKDGCGIAAEVVSAVTMAAACSAQPVWI